MLERWRIALLVLLTLMTVATLTATWEFVIEDLTEPGSFARDDDESLEEKFEDTIEVTGFAALAMAVPVILLLRMRRRVLEAFEREQAANRAKTDFLSIVSHELRSPLTALRGSLGLLQGHVVDDPTDRARTMDIAIRNCDRLAVLVEDVIDVTRIEQRQLKLRPKTVTARALIEKAVDFNIDLAHGGGSDLVIEEPVTETAVVVDEARMLQVFSNLISNAIKYAPKSDIRLGAKVIGGRVQFSVADQGPGMDPKDVERIFEQFGQLDQSNDRPQEGIGLGLYVAKSIVEAHDGKLAVATGIGLGATFHFSLRVAEDSPAA